MAMAATLAKQGVEHYAKNLKFIEEEIKILDELRPALATPNRVRLDLRTMRLRDYGAHRAEDGARRPYRSVHGRQDAPRALAGDRPLDRRAVDRRADAAAVTAREEVARYAGGVGFASNGSRGRQRFRQARPRTLRGFNLQFARSGASMRGKRGFTGRCVQETR
jgi:hypothetical protein